MERRVEHLAKDDLLRGRSLAGGLLGLASSGRGGHAAHDARAGEEGRNLKSIALRDLSRCIRERKCRFVHGCDRWHSLVLRPGSRE